jgi:hypothetical protein
MARSPEQIERLLDAVELIKDDRRSEAFAMLRTLINEDSDFEDAWLWMSMAVDSLDQSAVCLENVLRVNPANGHAAGALYRMREPEREVEQRRDTLRSLRDITTLLLWMLIAATLCAVAGTYAGAYTFAVELLP